MAIRKTLRGISVVMTAICAFYVRWGWLLGLVIMGLVFHLLCGCSVGRGDAGEIIVGVEMGRMVETFGQAAQFGLNMLPPPWGALGNIILPLVTGVGGAYATKLARDKSDALYDEGLARGTMESLAVAVAEKPLPVRGL